MILVVEGISASGKTTWCAMHGARNTVAENGRFEDAPDRVNDPIGAARFWAERNVDRWQAAIALESATSLAVCDTDPLKLHYIWCLWQIGEASESDWLLAFEATRETIAQGRIGFADCYLVGTIQPELARRRAKADRTRSRRNFELNTRLQPSLVAWYSALNIVLPGRVRFGLPLTTPKLDSGGVRYDPATFDRLINVLPRPSAM